MTTTMMWFRGSEKVVGGTGKSVFDELARGVDEQILEGVEDRSVSQKWVRWFHDGKP